MIKTRDQAVHLLAGSPSCVDDVIVALERFSPSDAQAASDLAAAYYVRAQRKDVASDLLWSLDAANDAVARAPQLAAARFNQALALEALGLRDEALAAWDAAGTLRGSPWTAEARAHRESLVKARNAAARWDDNRQQLSAALAQHDQATAEHLIAPFPATSERYFEDELVPQWADRPTAERLAEVRMFAEAHARATGNRYCLDVANAIAAASPETIRILQRAHQEFRKARGKERALDMIQAAAGYRRAAELLDAAGSPLSLLARIKEVIGASYRPGQIHPALALLEPLERSAQQRGYEHLVARIDASREFLLRQEGHYVQALAELDKAMAGYRRIHDDESYVATRLHAIGDYRIVGQSEHSLREALGLSRHLPEIVDVQTRHAVLGDAAATVLALGHPDIALLYQTDALSLIGRELSATTSANGDEAKRLHRNLHIAYRERAWIKLQLPYDESANITSDLRQAARWIEKDKSSTREDREILNIVNVRFEEVKGRSKLGVNPHEAVQSFTRALGLIRNENFLTLRAGLLAQRAEAHRKAGQSADAKSDLLMAIRELHREEKDNLERRGRGEAERFWSLYFSRFQDIYRRLIRQLIDETRTEEAFTYVEKARAIEPLNLILNTNVVPAAFRGLTEGEPLALAEIQSHLPAGTALIEFCVLDDDTYAFIVSHDHFEVVEQHVGRSKIRRWTETLQRAARLSDKDGVDAALRAASSELFAKPLGAVDKLALPPGQLRRLVFIPDDALYALPFAALHHEATGQYLIEDAVVSSAGSATLYVFSLLRDQALPAQAAPVVLLVDTPAYDTTLPFAQGLDPLTGATMEIQGLEHIYEHTEILRKGEATVPRFFDGARTSDVIHFAGHAFANAAEPSKSFLLLAPSPSESGVLDAETLVKRLHADRTRLVVLSACRSAGGLPVGPEGVAPLVRPLIGAGIPGVIGSLWNVQDATAPALLVSFHRAYRSKDAAMALRSAQLDLLHRKNPGLASVLAWAPFEVIGYASSPFGATRDIEGEPP